MAELDQPAPGHRVTCEACKSRKLRCDRKYPSCTRCSKAGIDCHYLSQRKPGFPAGQRRVLEDKIARLEAQLEQRQQPDSRMLLSPKSAAPVEWEQATTTSTYHSSQIQSGAGATPTSPAIAPEQKIATFERTRRVVERQPPTDLLVSLVSLFFRHVHIWIPFLDAGRVLTELGANEPSLLNLALFNIALTHSFDSRLDRASSDAFWKYSKRRVFVECLEEPSYAALEALTIVTLDLSGMTNGPQAWGALAIIIKLASQQRTIEGRSLRNKVPDEARLTYSANDQLHRRRLFWAIYAVDSYLTITTAHPSDMTDFHIQRFLPTRKITWQDWPYTNGDSGWQSHVDQLRMLSTSASLTFYYQLELLDISRNVHRTYLQYISAEHSYNGHDWMQDYAQSSTELESWQHTLPMSSLGTYPLPNSQTSPPLVMLYAYYHALNIHLHGIVVCQKTSSPETGFSSVQLIAQRRCTESIGALTAIVQHSASGTIDKLGWPFAWSIWIAGRYLLAANHIGVQYSSEDFDLLLGCLSSLGRYWQISTKYWNLLNKASTELAAGSANPRAEAPVLEAVTNLSICTSDLEDQFRIDPVLNGRRSPNQATVSADGPEMMIWNESVVGQEEQIPMGPDFTKTDPFSNTWFSLPLYAASAYQQYSPFS